MQDWVIMPSRWCVDPHIAKPHRADHGAMWPAESM